MKKIILLIAILIMNTNAVYADDNSCGENCIYELNDDVLIVKPEDSGKPAIIKKEAFYERKDFIKVRIENGITEIGIHSFAYTHVAKIQIPNTVKIIKEYAFVGSDLIGKLILPDSIEYIEKSAFYKTKLKKVKLSQNLKSIGDSAFGDTEISGVDIPDSVLYVGKYAFATSEFTTLTISDDTEVSNDAFFNETLVLEMGQKAHYQKLKTVYCRGDIETCKENLENEIDEKTQFIAVSEGEGEQ